MNSNTHGMRRCCLQTLSVSCSNLDNEYTIIFDTFLRIRVGIDRIQCNYRGFAQGSRTRKYAYKIIPSEKIQRTYACKIVPSERIQRTYACKIVPSERIQRKYAYKIIRRIAQKLPRMDQESPGSPGSPGSPAAPRRAQKAQIVWFSSSARNHCK